MHQVVVGVADLVEELAEANRTISRFEKEKSISIEQAKNELRKEMEKNLVESDIKREVAIARLESYERMASKDDISKEIREMLKMAIQSLGSARQGGGGQKQPQ